MTMYTEYTYNDSLAHHGILGQKWGVLNGPPYPLSYQSHSRTEQKRNSTSRIDGISKHNKPKSSDNRLIKENKKNSKNNVQTIKSKPSTKIASKSTPKPKVSTKPSNKSETKGKKQLTEKQKKILKGVAIGAGIAAVAGLSAYAYHKNPEVKKAVDNLVAKAKLKSIDALDKVDAGKDKVNQKLYTAKSLTKDKLSKLDKRGKYIIGDDGRKIYTEFADGTKNPLAKDGFSLTKNAALGVPKTKVDFDEDLLVTNKGAKGVIFGRSHNCFKCVTNMEARWNGLDSVAAPNSGEYSDDPQKILGNMSKIFGLSSEERKAIKKQSLNGLLIDKARKNGTDLPEIMKPNDFVSQLKSQPNTRGIICARHTGWGAGSEHFMNYRVTKSGKLKIYDGYSNKRLTEKIFTNNPEDLKKGLKLDIKNLNKQSISAKLSDMKKQEYAYSTEGIVFFRTDNKKMDLKVAADLGYIQPNTGDVYNINKKRAAKYRAYARAYRDWDFENIPKRLQDSISKDTINEGRSLYSMSPDVSLMKGIY